MNSIDALESMKEERKIIIDVFEEDQAIRIVIKNNGPMIPAENVETIFEPFVTTKKLELVLDYLYVNKLWKNIMDPLCVDQITIGQNFKLH